MLKFPDVFLVDKNPHLRLITYNFSLTTPGRRGPSFNYQCPYKKCSKVFSNQSRRNGHILKTHRNPTGETPKDCQICGIKVSNNYEDHKRLYHKSKDCKECNITFNGVNAFLEHQRKVHGDIHTCQVLIILITDGLTIHGL